MKNNQKISDSEIDGIIYQYYEAEIGGAGKGYVPNVVSSLANQETFSVRNNRITNFVFISSMVVCVSFCFLFHNHTPSLEKAVTQYYVHNKIDERIPEAIKFIKDNFTIKK